LTVSNGQIFNVASADDLAPYTNVVVQSGGTLNVTGTSDPLAGRTVTIAGRGTTGTNEALFFNSSGNWTNGGSIRIDGSAGIHLGNASRTIATTSQVAEVSPGASLWLTAGHTNVALDFRAAANFTGGLTVSGAVFFAQTANALRGGDLVITNRGGFRVSAANQALPGDLILHSGRVWNSATSVRTIRANAFLVHEGAIGTLTNTGRLILADNTNVATPLIKSGAGTLTLRAQGTYTGGTDIRGGTVIFASDSVGGDDLLPTDGAVSISNGATLNFSNFSQTVAGLTGAGTVIGTGGTLTVAPAGTNDVFGGILTGTLGLTKAGPNTLTLTGTNTSTGQVTLADGTLILDGVVPGAVTVGPNTTLSGSGVIGGPTTIRGTHRPGNGPGLPRFDNGLTYEEATVEWELSANSTAGRGTAHSGIDVGGGVLDFATVTTLALRFTGAVDWDDAFWDQEHTGTSGWRVFQAGEAINRPDNLRLQTMWRDSRGRELVRGRGVFTLHHDPVSHAIYLNYRRPSGGGTSVGFR
jgi:autotransporter-associated beta strand protein